MRNKKEKIYFIYLDRTGNTVIDRPDRINKVFYVGKGTEERVKIKKRNKVWQHIVNKYGWELNNREIILATKDEKFAFEIEKYYIKLHKTFARAWKDGSGWGANLTEGGDGPSGIILSKEARERIRQSKLGSKHPLYNRGFSEETRNKMSVKRSGSKNSQAILKEEQVIEIIHKYITGNYTQEQLGREYKVSRGCIKHIINGDCWNIKKLVPPEIFNLIPKHPKKIKYKLNFSDAENIRSKYNTGNYTVKKLAKEYRVNVRFIGSIINNKCLIKDSNEK